MPEAEAKANRKQSQSWLCYVSTSGDKGRLAERFARFGWFEKGDVFARQAEVVDVAETNLPQPTRGAAELINPIFTGIDRLSCLHAANQVYVIVDSLTTLLKDSTGEGDRRRNAQELVSRFRMAFKERLGLLILVAEFPPGHTAGFSAEEHVADVVFQLQSKTIGLGRRRRTLEAVKARSTDMATGLHSWDIVSRYEKSVDPQEYPFREPRLGLASGDLIKHIKEKAVEVEKEDAACDWCTIAIFPRPHLYPIHHLQGWKKGDYEPPTQASRIFTGVPGLDEMLRGEVDYWVSPDERGSADSELRGRQRPRLLGLRQGSVTLILGKSGTGKTLACLQFLLAQSKALRSTHEDSPLAGSRENTESAVKRALYINFENRPSRIRDLFPGRKEQVDSLLSCQTLYHRHADLDMNCLLAEIRYLVRNKKIERIAIDGLSDLFAGLNRQEWSMLIEDLLVSLRQDRLGQYARKKKTGDESDNPPLPTILMTLETDAGLDALPTLGALSFAADNLLVFEHVVVNDVVRNTVRVVKARGCSPDRQTREAIVRSNTKYPFQIVPGLENYRGLRSPRPTPVQIALQLIAENVNEERFNRELCERLRSLFAFPVKAFGFSRSELMRTLRDISAGVTRIPQADVKVLSIDEWWIRELDPRHRWPDASGGEHALLPLETYVAHAPSSGSEPEKQGPHVPSDYWIPELEKVCVPVAFDAEQSLPAKPTELPAAPSTEAPPDDSISAGESAQTTPRPENPYVSRRINVVAYPCYIDFGIFCVNPAVASRRTNSQGNPGNWLSWLSKVPRAWAELDQDQWFTAPCTSGPPRTVVDFMKATIEARERDCIGYAFDMETTSTVASAALELCWAFGATENFLMQDAGRFGLPEKQFDGGCQGVGKDDEWIKSHPLTLALQLLEFLVVEGLMPARTSVRDAARAVFCRHWYSTLFPMEAAFPDAADARGEAAAGKVAHPASVMPLLFFPVGQLRAGEKGVAGPRLVALQDALF
ncbi:MAG: ATPase domain-containing protein, partial [Thermoguttaceae bacterium]